MSRRPDPDRIDTARRAAVLARLRSDGHPAAEAAALVAQFAAEHGGRPGREGWDGFDDWLDRSRRPPPRPPPQLPQGATFRQFATTSLTVWVPFAP